MSDARRKTLELAVALRAAGLTEKADALLADEVRKEIGTPPAGSFAELGDRLADVRSKLGLAPMRTRRAKPGVGRARRKVAAMLLELGYQLEPDDIRCSVGWTRSVHKQHDDTTLSWDAWAVRRRVVAVDGKEHAVAVKVHLVSWDRLTECARHGIALTENGDHMQAPLRILVCLVAT